MIKGKSKAAILIISVIVLSAANGLTNPICRGTEIDYNSITVVPCPYKIEILKGEFIIGSETDIVATKDTHKIGQYLADLLRPATGFNLQVVQSSPDNKNESSIFLLNSSAKSRLGDEGYDLKVLSNSVFITAPTEKGVFYGVQTLRQLLPEAIESKQKVQDINWCVPRVEIEDKPGFSWRGLLLDSARHFQSKEFIKRYIDLLAYHKMNRFHWHLNDDQGWRIEIKKYPKLTEIGAWRKEEQGCIGRHYKRACKFSPENEKNRIMTATGEKTAELRDGLKWCTHGGFYTQQDIREIVEYAKSRYIEIIPEIEMPGHCQAALASYPQFSCSGGPFTVRLCAGVSEEVYCAGNEETFKFLEDVLSEIIELFPGKYIHVGGDECPKVRWQQCPKCQKRIKELGLKDEHELQRYFIGRIENFLNSKNRRLIGWDEILETKSSGLGYDVEITYDANNLSKNAIIQSWRNMQGAIAAAKAGFDTIVSPISHCYLNLPYEQISLQKVYSFKPMPEGLAIEQQQHVLGGEVNMWTELTDQQAIDKQVFPRLTAMAEILWSPADKCNWEDFSRRMDTQYKRFDKMGIQAQMP